jgi:hypothetical protein
MPLYKVAYKDSFEMYEASCPSAAACKAYNSLRRKESIDTIELVVYTEGKRYSTKYSVFLSAIESPNAHEVKHNIVYTCKAVKVHVGN